MALYTYQPILTIVQAACVQLNLAKPSGVYDSQDENAILMGSYANLVGQMLADVDDWQQFNTNFSITGDGMKTAWTLPPDFDEFVSDTGWSLSNRRPVIILNDQQWAAIKAWISTSYFINPACYLALDQLEFITAPGLNEVIEFAYSSSRFWVINGQTPTTRQEALLTNADVPMFDSLLFTIALKLKWLEVRGMPTGPQQREFDTRLDQIKSRNVMAGTLSMNGGTMTGFRYLDNWANSPDTGYGG